MNFQQRENRNNSLIFTSSHLTTPSVLQVPYNSSNEKENSNVEFHILPPTPTLTPGCVGGKD